jgi:hypothetical protein
MIDLGIRIGGRTLLVQLNGAWLAIDLSKRHAITVEFGKVAVDTLEPVEHRD